MHMKWSGYAGVQYRDGNAAMTPFKSFYANYATTTMGSFSDVSDMAICQGVVPPTAPPGNAPNSIGPGDPELRAHSDHSRRATRTCTTRIWPAEGHQTTRCPLVGRKV